MSYLLGKVFTEADFADEVGTGLVVTGANPVPSVDNMNNAPGLVGGSQAPTWMVGVGALAVSIWFLTR